MLKMTKNENLDEIGIDEIGNTYPSLIECDTDSCSTPGKFFKCYFGKMFEQCSTYLQINSNSTKG